MGSLDERREVVRNWQHRIINTVPDLNPAVDARVLASLPMVALRVRREKERKQARQESTT